MTYRFEMKFSVYFESDVILDIWPLSDLLSAKSRSNVKAVQFGRVTYRFGMRFCVDFESDLIFDL